MKIEPSEPNKTPSEKPNETVAEYKPIICPICGNHEITFITEYHKCIVLKIFRTISIIIEIILSVFLLQNILLKQTVSITIVGIGSVLLIFTIFLSAIIYKEESKTHIQAICRNCGNIWLLN